MVTCLLSVSRTIKITYPFYQISSKGIWWSCAGITAVQVVSVVCSLLTEGEVFEESEWRFNPFHVVMFVEMVLILITVLISTILSIWQLGKSTEIGTEHSLKRRATITIIIISVLYLIFNGILMIAFLDNVLILNSTPQEIERFSLYLGSPLNSTLNPLVILARKKTVRQLAVFNIYNKKRLGGNRVAEKSTYSIVIPRRSRAPEQVSLCTTLRQALITGFWTRSGQSLSPLQRYASARRSATASLVVALRERRKVKTWVVELLPGV
eukprot:sb/3468255/